MRKTKNDTTRVTPHTHLVAELLSTAQNSSQECTKDFKIPSYIWNLKLCLVIPRDNRILCQSMFDKLFKPSAECWARPRILPQVPDGIPPKIRFFLWGLGRV